MKPLSLQLRVALVSAILITVGMLLCGTMIVVIAYEEDIEGIDLQLEAEAQHVFSEWQRHGGAARYNLADKENSVREWLPEAFPPRLAEVTGANEVIIFRSARLTDDALRGQPPGFRTLQIDGHPWRFAGFERDGVSLRIAADLEPVHELVKRLVLSFVAAMPLLLGFAWLGGRWVGRQALEPVRRIIAAAERVTVDHSELTVPVPEARDEIRRLAIVLNGTFERLKTSYEQAKRFSADASHELKTPLTVLRASVETLLESPMLSPQDQDSVAALLEQIRRLGAITESLLLLSRADAGRLLLDFAAADVGEVIEACIEDARILADAAGITIETEGPSSFLATVDRGRLSHILVNLLDNAVKYNEPGGRIRITTRIERGAVEIAVGNTGPGIAPEDRKRIFERFFRAASVPHEGGHGLGLSLSRELARAHGGELTLEKSGPGWTEFRLIVPVQAEHRDAGHETTEYRVTPLNWRKGSSGSF